MSYTEHEFIALRKKIIEKDFGRMNSMQLSAVVTAKGPLLVLAGAGSGKTTVLVNRIACLVKYGDAYNSSFVPQISDADYEQGQQFLVGQADTLPAGAFSLYPAQPWEILAITFTNKAAGELKNRIAQRLGDTAGDLWAGTFHSICARILRRNGDRLGYTSHFTIYDTDDQKRVVKTILKQAGISDKELPPKYILNEIGRAKDKMLSPADYTAQAGINPMKKAVGQIFEKYQQALKTADAMDFDDIIFNTVTLFAKHPDVLEYYTNKFKYVMVDEYQDTNHAQYLLVSQLASRHRNICVVGDDDQSIYAFRGATIENILNFEDSYPDAKVIRLEQNYRSTSTILDAANAIIANNKGRKGKNLWTDCKDDSKISVNTLLSEQEEARFVADSILEHVRAGGRFNDNAVLYRMNALSGTLENVFVRTGIPYKVVGGLRFFDRKEIKDVIAYLNVINNPADTVRLKRIINEPKRGIGEATIGTAEAIADGLGLTLFEVLSHAADYPALSRAAGRLQVFMNVMRELIDISEQQPLNALLSETLTRTGYLGALKAEGEEALDRVENVQELLSGIKTYEQEAEAPSLSEYLEEVALISDLDSYNDDNDSVVMMTLHSAKGLEFHTVYLVGMEENIFPGTQSIYTGEAELEEERRLAYVGVTRAKRLLYITNTRTRMLFGMTQRNRPSRFLQEIPEKLCDIHGTHEQAAAPAYVYGRHSGSGASTTLSPTKSYGSTPAIKKVKAPAVQYTKGMRVKHKVFGEGTVLSSTPMGGDSLVEIAFDSKGTKKLMSNFVKMEIL